MGKWEDFKKYVSSLFNKGEEVTTEKSNQEFYPTEEINDSHQHSDKHRDSSEEPKLRVNEVANLQEELDDRKAELHQQFQEIQKTTKVERVDEMDKNIAKGTKAFNDKNNKSRTIKKLDSDGNPVKSSVLDKVKQAATTGKQGVKTGFGWTEREAHKTKVDAAKGKSEASK